MLELIGREPSLHRARHLFGDVERALLVQVLQGASAHAADQGPACDPGPGRECRRHRHRRRARLACSRWRATTTRATSSPIRARPPASAASCATCSPWARGRSPASMRCRSAIPSIPRRAIWSPAWSPASAATAIPSACRRWAARCASTRATTATTWSTPWRSASREKDKIFYAAASGVGMPIVYLGSKTGRDGIHGASMASAEFGEDSEAKRPTVQVGDPFSEKLLLEACLEIMHKGCVIAIQDMGAAGLTCSAVEMGAKGDLGVTLDLDKVPCREEGMSAYEMMLSESQERMLMVLKPEKEKEAEAIFRKWGLDFAVVGETTPTKRFIVRHGGDVMADLPIKELGDQAPEYKRPFVSAAEARRHRRRRRRGADGRRRRAGKAASARRISAPSAGSGSNTTTSFSATPCSGRAATPRWCACENGPKGLALTTDVTPRYCEADPFEGGKQAVAECWRNLTAVGAQAARRHRQSQFRQSGAAGDHGPVRRLHPRHRRSLQGARLSRSCPAMCRSTTRPTARAILPTPSIGGVGLHRRFHQVGVARLQARRRGDPAGRRDHRLARPVDVSARVCAGARRAPRRRSISLEERENGDFVRALILDGTRDRRARSFRRRPGGRARRDGDGVRHRRGARRRARRYPGACLLVRRGPGALPRHRAGGEGRGGARRAPARRACRCGQSGQPAATH